METQLGGPFTDYLGVQFEEVTADRVVATWTANALHQPFGIVHGGAHCGVVETLASIGAAVWLGDRGKVVGVNNSTDFYRAVSEGDDLDGDPGPPRPVPAGLGRRDRRRRGPDGVPRPGAAAEPHRLTLGRHRRVVATASAAQTATGVLDPSRCCGNTDTYGGSRAASPSVACGAGTNCSSTRLATVCAWASAQQSSWGVRS